MDTGIDTDRLVAFVTVARERGFSRAARRLGRTQSSVSQTIARLEQELGQKLFARDRRATQLTEAGRLLLERAEGILAEMQRARAELSALGGLQRGELVVGASDTLAYYVLPPVFALFRTRHPGVELRLENRPSPATAEQVAARNVDLGIVSLPLDPGLHVGGRPWSVRLRTEALKPQRDVVICPPGHALGRRSRVDLAGLLPYPLLLLDRSTATRASIEARLRTLSPRPQIAMEMSSVEVLKRLVELGFGVSIVPEIAIQRERAARALLSVPLTGGVGRRAIGLLTPRDADPSPAAAAFAELCRELLRERRRDSD